MSDMDIMDIIKKRRSVRTFDKRPVSEEDRQKLTDFFSEIENPYDIPVEFRLLEAREHGLKSQVLKGETLYLGAKVKRSGHFEEAFGYSLEAVVLFAWSLGIGTVWIASTMNRDAFERAMELGDDEIMPCITPLGYAADKMSMVESLMRRTMGSDKRMELSEIVFDGEYGKGFSPEKGTVLFNVLEMTRWAPSARNKQPWRMIVSGDSVHFYEKQDWGFNRDETGDIQKTDVGIAMYHFDKAMEASGKTVTLKIADPGLTVPDDVRYVSTYVWE